MNPLHLPAVLTVVLGAIIGLTAGLAATLGKKLRSGEQAAINRIPIPVIKALAVVGSDELFKAIEDHKAAIEASAARMGIPSGAINAGIAFLDGLALATVDPGAPPAPPAFDTLPTPAMPGTTTGPVPGPAPATAAVTIHLDPTTPVAPASQDPTEQARIQAMIAQALQQAMANPAPAAPAPASPTAPQG